MAMQKNIIEFEGRLARDPHFATNRANGRKDVALCRIINNRAYKGQNGWIDTTVGMDVACYGKHLETLKGLKKGDHVTLLGAVGEGSPIHVKRDDNGKIVDFNIRRPQIRLTDGFGKITQHTDEPTDGEATATAAAPSVQDALPDANAASANADTVAAATPAPVEGEVVSGDECPV